MAEAHIRIDEGIKRGPRLTHKGRRRSPKADLGSWTIPPNLDPDEILQRYLTETTTSHIAQQYGLSRKALTKWLREVRRDEWKQAQIIRALARKEDGEDGMMDATDALSLARAREVVKAAQFDLTSLDPDYQPKQELTIKPDPDLAITSQLVQACKDAFLAILAAPQQSRQVIEVTDDTSQQSDEIKP